MFYQEGFRRPQKKTVFGKAKKLEPQPLGAAFQDSFKRKQLEYDELQPHGDIINSYLDIPKKVEIDLSKATLAQLLEVDVPNPDDTSWLQEKQRIITTLKAQGKNSAEIQKYLKENPPLGRSQFTRKEQRSLASANLPLNKKIDELTQEIREGRNTSDEQRANIIIQLVDIMAKSKEIEKLISENKPQIQGMLGSVPKGTTYQTFDLPFRGMDAKELKQHTGSIAVLILKQALEQNIPIEEPVLVQSDSKNPNNITRMKLSTLFNQRADAKSYLDLFTKDGKIVWRSMEFVGQIKADLRIAGQQETDIQQLFSFDISSL